MKEQFTTFSIIIFLALGCFLITGSARAETEVSGNITTDTTWTLADSPYIVTETIYVWNGTKLTIKPGVIVKFNKGAGLVVNGEIYAVGDANNLITFTTNEPNPNKLYKIPQDWYWGGIHIGEYSVGTVFSNVNNYLSGNIIKYSVIEYAGIGISDVNNSPLFIDNNIIRYNNWGINSYGGSVVSNNTIDSNATYGINLYFSKAIISYNTITNNAIEGSAFPDFDLWDFAAIKIQGGEPSIFKNNIKNNARGFSWWYSGNPTIEYNNIYNNEDRNFKSQASGNTPYNYWGSSSISEIDSTIQDGYINTGVRKIFYEPYGLAELKFDGTDTFSQPPTCTSWTYSGWSACQSNGAQTRTVVSSSPNGCSGGNPVLTQNCTYVPPTCTSWTYSEWSSCSTSGQQTRSIISSSPSGCVGGNPVLTQTCTYVPPVCTSWTYSGWSTCQSNGIQTRTIISSSPSGCSGGNPILTQLCTYTPPTCTSWTYSDWGACVNNQQTRTIILSQPANCTGGNPILSQSCNSTPLCTENNWTSMLSPTVCSSNGQQTRKWTKIGQCQGGVSRPAEEIISCNYQALTCTSFVYSDWSICNTSGVQSRTTLSTSPSGCTGGNPVLSKSCNYIPPCTSDTWFCGDWSDCSANGSQTRICTKTFDCPDIQTASPITNQHCEISNKPTTQQTTQIKNNEQEVNQEKNTTGSQVAEQRRSEVASAVQEILQVAERDSGIGQQVKIIAQTQAQNQEELETSLQKVQSRSGFAKFFIGPNYGEINNAKKLLEQNREQIKQLNQVKNQLADQDDQQKLTEQVQLLEQANQEIENFLNTSQKGFSLFGWLFRLFAK